MKLTKMISAALAAVMLCGSLSALPASARDVEVDPCGLWNTPGQGFAPQSREVFYTTTPESYDILDRGFGRISVKVRRTAISVTMNEPLTESITLGDFTLRPEYAKGKSDQYICTVEPQAEYLGRKARGSRLYVSDDADLTHCWQTRLEKTAETVPEENSYIIWQMSASAAQDDTEAYMQLFEALEADPRFTVKGAVYVCTQWYAPYTDWLYVQYADDSAEADVEAELTALGCDTSGKGRNPDENPAEDYWEYPCPAAAAKAIIEQFAADPRIGTIEPKSCVDGVEGSETFDVTALLFPFALSSGYQRDVEVDTRGWESTPGQGFAPLAKCQISIK